MKILRLVGSLSPKRDCNACNKLYRAVGYGSCGFRCIRDEHMTMNKNKMDLRIRNFVRIKPDDSLKEPKPHEVSYTDKLLHTDGLRHVKLFGTRTYAIECRCGLCGVCDY